ncbi:MAG: hypothetical protein J5736_00930 [Bacilli bacterium]|nr:hypothetical protein [Bacilli bacterium]
MKNEITKTMEKLLLVVYELKKHRLMPSMDGAIKILQGKTDEETLPLRKLKCFGLLISLHSKRAKMIFHQLVRNGYLDQKYVECDYFLTLTKKGMAIARESFSKLTPKKEGKAKRKTIRPIAEGVI